MSRPCSIYVVFLRSIFYFQLHFNCHSLYNVIKTDALVFVNFKECLLSFLEITWIKKKNNFQKVRVPPPGIA